MLRQIRQLFARYAERHMLVTWPAISLSDESGAQIGEVETIKVTRGRIHITGWVIADDVTLSAPRAGVETMSAATDLGDIKFTLSRLYLGDGPGQLAVRRGTVRHHFTLPAPTAAQRKWQKAKLLPRFATAMIGCTPLLLRWKFNQDVNARAKIKAVMGLNDAADFVPELPQDLFLRQPGHPPADTQVTLILPVYNAFDLLKDALQRIIAHTDLPWHLILVEDASTDRNVRPFLRDWIAQHNGRVTLIENPKNLGFIGSVNRAFTRAIDRGNPVILINSDAFVPMYWASRLMAPIISMPDVASVTPMSNNAEILSVPKMGEITTLAPSQADAIDAVAANVNFDAAHAVLPTGVGFCMAMNFEFLRKVPSFDTSFGSGYGEEVDWCQRTRALGGRHIGIGSLFVEHKGGASFGDEQKLAMVTKNNALISSRYPEYDAEVQAFLRDDPLAPARLALGIAYVATRATHPIAIYLGHSMGGGAEMDLQRRLKADGTAIVLRVGGTRRWRIILHDGDAELQAQTDDFTLIQQLLDPIQHRRIIYSNGVGDSDMISLPQHLLDLKRRDSDQIELLFHDFLPLSQSFTLLDSDSVFHGTPNVSNNDRAHNTPKTLADWRKAWGALVNAADRLEVFSHDSAAHVSAAYPTAAPKIDIKPHLPMVTTTSVKLRNGSPTLGILGNIGVQKGAQVLVDLAKTYQRSGEVRMVLIGNIDPNFALPKSVKIHGSYDSQDITTLSERYGITQWLIPSIWPETFSFTTHEALATGLPVWCFDIGAQGEAARAAPNGHIIPFDPIQNPAHAVQKALAL